MKHQLRGLQHILRRHFIAHANGTLGIVRHFWPEFSGKKGLDSACDVTVTTIGCTG